MDPARSGRFAVALITTLLGASGVANAQGTRARNVEQLCEVGERVGAPEGEANGIAVARPKIFDEAALDRMLQGAERRLAELRFIDPAVLEQAAGAVSGGERHSRHLSASVSRLPHGDGEPTLPGPSGNFQSPQLSLAGRDLLAEQLQLTYQVANLRLALEQSLSDRISGIPVLLGFEVSVDAANRHRGQVAEVQVTIDGLKGSRNPSLLTLLPERNTYNTYTITQDSRQIGLGVIAGVFSLGASGGKEGETFYVLQEADTVALQMVPDGASSADALSFGWQLRPVLGRKAVEPGRRMLFALVSLPRNETAESLLWNSPGSADGELSPQWAREGKGLLQNILGRIRIATRWREWNSDRRTTGREIGPGRSERYRWVLTDPSRCRNLFVPEAELLNWTASGDDRVMVSVIGRNLGQGTRIVLGETVIDEHRGLRLVDDRELVFTVSRQTLMSTPQLIENRFGVTRLAYATDWPSEARQPQATASVRYRSSSMVEIVLDLDGFDSSKLLVELGGQYFAERDLEEETIDLKASWEEGRFVSRRVVFRAHPDLVRKADHVGVVAPFTGQSAEAPLSGMELVRLSDGEEVLLGIHGSGFGESTAVQVGKVEIGWRRDGEAVSSRRYFRHQSPNFLSLEVSEAELSSVRYLLMLDAERPYDPPRLIPLSVPPKPKAPGPPKVHQGDSVWVSAPRADSRRIERIEFEGETLSHRTSGTEVAIRITTDVTRIPGRKELSLFLADGEVVTTPVEVLPRSSADR